MNKNNIILNRFFTQNVFFDMIHNKNNSTFGTVIQRYVSDTDDKNIGSLISEIYKYMSKEYRNEYFYQNTLLNKLLLGKHSVNTTTAITQIPINKSKADFILINGKAVVYEIKTELDTFDRLESQLRDYYMAFDHVCLVTSERQYKRAASILADSPVGIYVLTSQNTISTKLKKDPISYSSALDYSAIFKVLNKREFENIIFQYYGDLPETSQAFYYSECFKRFAKLPILEAYNLALVQLKKRNKILHYELDKVPYELKSLVYFSNFNKKNWKTFNTFLSEEYGG